MLKFVRDEDQDCMRAIEPKTWAGRAKHCAGTAVACAVEGRGGSYCVS